MSVVADTIIVLIMCISYKGMQENADTTFLNRETISEMRTASNEAAKHASEKTRRQREKAFSYTDEDGIAKASLRQADALVKILKEGDPNNDGNSGF